jgi:hypothetical protein
MENGGSGSLNAPASNDISFLITQMVKWSSPNICLPEDIELQMLSIGIDLIRAARPRSSRTQQTVVAIVAGNKKGGEAPAYQSKSKKE